MKRYEKIAKLKKRIQNAGRLFARSLRMADKYADEIARMQRTLRKYETKK